jgi:hypothetical protein
MVFFSAALLVAIAAPPLPAVAQMLRCASHSLSRQEIARAEAAARPALPSAIHLVAAGACWNPDFARVWLETPKVLTLEGVQQKWAVGCQRKESTWTCDAPEFKQVIVVTLQVGGDTRRVELNFDQGTSLRRARALAARALAIYADPTSRVPTCGDGTVENPPSDPHQSAGPYLRGDPIKVTVSRRDIRDSVELEDIYREFEFPRAEDDASMQQAPCWLDVIVVT